MITPLLYDYIKQVSFRGDRVEIVAKSPHGYTRRLFYLDGNFVVVASKKGVRQFVCYRGPSAVVAESIFIDYMTPSAANDYRETWPAANMELEQLLGGHGKAYFSLVQDRIKEQP